MQQAFMFLFIPKRRQKKSFCLIILPCHCSSSSRGMAIDRVSLPPPHYGSASFTTSNPPRPSVPSAGAAVGRATPASDDNVRALYIYLKVTYLFVRVSNKIAVFYI